MNYPTKNKLISCLILVVSVSNLAQSLNNGLAKTPPMGWISWERFTCETDCDKYPDSCINSKLYLDMAKKMVDGGFKDVGYDYVNIDDCWSEKQRSSTNERLIPDAKRFPEGMKSLAGQIQKLGLKFGIYGDCGTATCAGYPAQLKSESNYEDNYFVIDANTFAEWQVDSFKFDGCYIEPFKAESICPRMAAALNASTRSILLTCEWPFYMLRNRSSEIKPDYALSAESCNLWRYYEDVEDSWQSILNVIDFTVAMQDNITKHHGPGGWFDPDQLVIGNFGLSVDQAKAQMAIWSIWSAPLFMSNDLRDIDPEYVAILKNEKVIAVDQDQLGVFGLMVAKSDTGSIMAFAKPVEKIQGGCPSYVIVYLNRNTLGNKVKVSFPLRDLLAKIPMALASRRYQEVYGGKFPGGEFEANACSERITKAMTRDPNSFSEKLLVKPSGTAQQPQIMDIKVEFKVDDLFGDEVLPNVFLNGTLDLYVNPSGIRMVKLVQV